MQSMSIAPIVSVRRQRTAILASLLLLTVAARALLVWQATHMYAAMASTPTMGMGAVLFDIGFCMAWTMRDGKAIRFREYNDSGKLLQIAAGESVTV